MKCIAKVFQIKKIYENIKNMGYSKEKITGDSAEPKSIDELKGYGLRSKVLKKAKTVY